MSFAYLEDNSSIDKMDKGCLPLPTKAGKLQKDGSFRLYKTKLWGAKHKSLLERYDAVLHASTDELETALSDFSWFLTVMLIEDGKTITSDSIEEAKGVAWRIKECIMKYKARSPTFLVYIMLGACRTPKIMRKYITKEFKDWDYDVVKYRKDISAVIKLHKSIIMGKSSAEAKKLVPKGSEEAADIHLFITHGYSASSDEIIPAVEETTPPPDVIPEKETMHDDIRGPKVLTRKEEMKVYRIYDDITGGRECSKLMFEIYMKGVKHGYRKGRGFPKMYFPDIVKKIILTKSYLRLECSLDELWETYNISVEIGVALGEIF